MYWIPLKVQKNIFSDGIRVLLRRGWAIWASMGNQLLRDGKKSQFDFVAILPAGAEQGPACTTDEVADGASSDLTLPTPRMRHLSSLASLVRHLTHPPYFLLGCPKFTWTVEVSNGWQDIWPPSKEEVQNAPLVCLLPPHFPLILWHESFSRGLFCSGFCVCKHATPWNIIWQTAISVRWLKLAQPLSVCNTVHMKSLGGITWSSSWIVKTIVRFYCHVTSTIFNFCMFLSKSPILGTMYGLKVLVSRGSNPSPKQWMNEWDPFWFQKFSYVLMCFNHIGKLVLIFILTFWLNWVNSFD